MCNYLLPQNSPPPGPPTSGPPGTEATPTSPPPYMDVGVTASAPPPHIGAELTQSAPPSFRPLAPRPASGERVVLADGTQIVIHQEDELL